MKKNIFLFLIVLNFILTFPKYSFAKTKTFTPAKWAKACQAKGGECVNKEFLDKDKNLKQIAGLKCDSKGLTVCVNKNVNGKYFCSRCSNTKSYQRASFYTDKQTCDDSTDPTNYQDSSQNKYIIDCECPEVKGGDNSAKAKCSNNPNTGTGKTNPNVRTGATTPRTQQTTNPRTQQTTNPFQQMTNSSRPITQQNPITQNPVINSGLTNPVNVGATTVPTGFQIPATLQNLIRGIIPTIQNPVVRGLLSGLVGGQNGTYTMINGTNIAVQDGQGANVILNLRIRFFSNANTNTAYRTIPIRVIIAGGGMSSPIGQVVNFTNAGNNLWTGRVGFQTNSNTNYSIYIKGPKHLQVKICDSSPRDNVNNNDILGIYKCGNVGQVLLRQGENNYDFTGIYMLPGDINQDGVLNNIDYGLLDSCFNWNIGADPNGQCSQADLNFDGAVNLMDKGLLDYVFTKNFKTSDDNF